MGERSSLREIRAWFTTIDNIWKTNARLTPFQIDSVLAAFGSLIDRAERAEGLPAPTPGGEEQ